jgi:hypothetical protein
MMGFMNQFCCTSPTTPTIVWGCVSSTTTAPTSPQIGYPPGAMAGVLRKAFGYEGNAMALPVASVDAALPFYERVFGFRVASRRDAPHRAVVLTRDDVRMCIEENGGDPTQDGCAFHVDGLDALFAEFKANGLGKEISEFDVEQHGEDSFRVFYVVAPDGLCYWFGERQARE